MNGNHGFLRSTQHQKAASNEILTRNSCFLLEEDYLLYRVSHPIPSSDPASRMASLCGVHAPRALEFSPAPTQFPRPQISTAVISSQFFRQSTPFNKIHRHSRTRDWVVGSVTEDREVVPVKDDGSEDTEIRLTLQGSDEPEGLSASSSSFSSKMDAGGGGDDSDRLTSRAINAIMVLGFGSFAVTKLLTIDHDYWHGWTLYEILRYVPEHNWIAYEQALQQNPVLAKMAISGIVYSIGDWIAQCYEGRPLFEFDRTRLFRSGLAGFTLHGSLSHYYYQLCEAIFPFQGWWVVPAKVAFDQTVWAAIWNSIYFVVLGLLRAESISNIYGELKSTFWPMLTAGWKLWPFAHLITYGVIPVEQRLLWVDGVELIWVTILSTYSNEKSEARTSEAAAEAALSNSSDNQQHENRREK